MKVFLFTIAFLALLSCCNCRVYQIIDQFGDSPPPLVLVVTQGGDTTPPYDWFSPYYQAGAGNGGDPGFQFRNTAAALGGQRDTILGYESASPQNSVAVMTVVGDAASVAFPLNYAGGAYFQWDGDDTGGNTSTAFPGARLNITPGIGQGVAFANGDNSIDFTFNGQASGIYISVKADHDVNYFLDAIDSNSEVNTYDFLVDIGTGNADQEIPFFFRYDDPVWSSDIFDWTIVRAFQVRIFTFTDGDNAQAVDTEFRLLRVAGYQISGNVAIDCLCDGSFEAFSENEQMDLFVTGNPTALTSTFTDIDGNYVFADDRITDGSYTVCLNDQTSPRCPSSPACRTFNILPFQNAGNDITGIDFVFTTTTSLSIPEDVSLECGDCSTPDCTGFAEAIGCTGTPVQINTWTDVVNPPSGVGCLVTITRTWVDPDTSARGTQTIILEDTNAPSIINPPTDVTQPCTDPSTYSTFISTRAGAVADDCNTVTWTPTANTEPLRCGTQTVTFTASDPCGFSTPVTATYTVFDDTAPTYSPGATSATAECNLKSGSSITALNNWIASRGGAVATDDCASSGQLINSNNFAGLTAGCSESTTVTFTTADGCGNTVQTTATFTISDTTDPIINPGASDSSAPCNTNGNDNTAFQTWLNNRAGARATDDCISDDANLTWTNDFVGGTVGGAGTCVQEIPVVFTVTDDCGFTATTSATFTISDTSVPSITTQAVNTNAQCDGSGNSADFAAWVADNGGARATDNCNDFGWSNDAGANPLTCGDATTVTFSVIDECGNGPRLTTATFTIIDTVPPSFVQNPLDDTVECSSTSTDDFNAWLANSAGATTTDNCSAAAVTITNNFTGAPLQPGCLNSATVRFTAVDPCGNQSPAQTAVFTIEDTTLPQITQIAQDSSVECNLATNNQAYQSFISTRGGAQATDSCATNVIWSNDGPASFAGNCNNAQTVTFTASDGCLNAVRTTATFSVTDSTLPTLVTPASDRTVECNGSGNTNDVNTFLSTRGGASATDNCGSVTWTNDFVALSGGCTSSATVTFTGCDPCSLCVATTATLTVTDTRGPTINPQASARSVECDPTSNDNQFDDWVNDNGGARATDICNQTGLTWTQSFVDSPFGCDSEEVTFTVTDPCGFSATTTAIFTILDTVGPTFTQNPQDRTVECDGAGNVSDFNSWVSSNAGATATDVCAISLVFSNNAPATGPVGCGQQQVTFTVTDECSNASTRQATYRVTDTTPPSITTAAFPQSVECDRNTNPADLQSWLNDNGGARASDVCYSNLSWSNNFVSLTSATCGQFADVTFTVSDPCGQRSTTSARFTVTDTQSPVITTQAGAAFFECDASANPTQISSYISSRGGATATDSCTTVSWTNDFVSAPEECSGPMSVTFTASDVCGNVAQTVGTIEIDDTVAPSFVNFPQNRRIFCDDSTDPAATGTPRFTDTCDSDVEFSFLDSQVQEPNDRFCPGDIIITRTWSAFDDCGNVATRDQIITVTIPVGECIPTPCPPCDGFVCCESSIEPVPCNPVACTAVPCVSTECDTVPCIPVVCEDDPVNVPIFDDDDDGLVNPPVATPAPRQCDPVYIYVFDDDEDIVNPIVVPETENSAGIMLPTFVFTLIIALIVLFV